jgi:hypothetical protein
MPNLVAYFALFAWPLVALGLFRIMPLQRALVWTVVGGHLLLPSATFVELPVIPALDRSSVVSLSALVLCLIFGRKSNLPGTEGKAFGRFVIWTLGGIAVFGVILTALFNSETLIYGPRYIPGLTAKDAAGMMITTALTLVPFWLGLRYLNTSEGHIELLKALALGGVVYSLPALVEIRLSPQLHVWIYGFFQHDFGQHIRQGGFRPVVFMPHGLVLGIFFCAAFLSALTLFKEARRTGAPAFGWFYAAVWLFLVLFVSKNFGALAIGIVISGFILFTGRRVQTIFAVTVAVVVLIFPLLRGAGWIPVDTIVEHVEGIEQDRAGSLRFRFINEEALLERANEKPLFGWGSWGRNQIYDPGDGRMTSVTDGVWVIFIGAFGWLGYIARFGLLAMPIIYYAAYRRALGPSYATQGLVLVLCCALIDLIPNSGLVVYVWLLSGAIAGHVLWKPALQREATQGPAPVSSSGPAPALGGAAAGQASWLMRAGTGQPARRSRRKGSTQRG